eukprot:7401095-Pyramimonas_sp.AAC.1
MKEVCPDTGTRAPWEPPFRSAAEVPWMWMSACIDNLAREFPRAHPASLESMAGPEVSPLEALVTPLAPSRSAVHGSLGSWTD